MDGRVGGTFSSGHCTDTHGVKLNVEAQTHAHDVERRRHAFFPWAWRSYGLPRALLATHLGQHGFRNVGSQLFRHGLKCTPVRLDICIQPRARLGGILPVRFTHLGDPDRRGRVDVRLRTRIDSGLDIGHLPSRRRVEHDSAMRIPVGRIAPARPPSVLLPVGAVVEAPVRDAELPSDRVRARRAVGHVDRRYMKEVFAWCGCGIESVGKINTRKLVLPVGAGPVRSVLVVHDGDRQPDAHGPNGVEVFDAKNDRKPLSWGVGCIVPWEKEVDLEIGGQRALCHGGRSQ
ncbi:hypothetical protein PG991_003283 [Apiospora marii]|uniref:Uncharacterized protein n=1 Tax=Apiospora marii TaxID=335849 RepID=A0ABR1SHR9_9PEZI